MNKINTVSCPVCQSADFDTLIEFGKIPISGTFLPTPETPYHSQELSFEYCKSCALICQQKRDNTCVDYQNVNRSTSGQMPAYVPNIVKQLDERQHDKQKLITDIGGNDGSFLNIISKTGFKNLLNIEPSTDLSLKSSQLHHNVENVHLTEKEAIRISNKYGSSKTIFCRHVLEHVPNPYELIVSIKNLLADDGNLFLEIPDACGILKGFLGHELWDEHLFHFTRHNVEHLLIRCGFSIDSLSVKPHRGGTNILIWAKNVPFHKRQPAGDYQSSLNDCKNFKENWKKLSDKIENYFRTLPGPIAFIGASHPQSNYALFTAAGKYVDFFVDDDPFKIGKYIPVPVPVPVISTQMLFADKKPGTVIKSAFGCDDWMSSICNKLSEKNIRIVDPYISPLSWGLND